MTRDVDVLLEQDRRLRTTLRNAKKPEIKLRTINSIRGVDDCPLYAFLTSGMRTIRHIPPARLQENVIQAKTELLPSPADRRAQHSEHREKTAISLHCWTRNTLKPH